MQVKIIFRPDGTIHREVFGAVGAECLSDPFKLEELFGKDGEQRFKPEFFQSHEEMQQELQ